MQIEYRRKRNRVCNLCFFVLAGILFCLLLLKCRYGYANFDETFYLEMTYRFWQGDAMLSGEWSLAQLFTFLLLPVVNLYLLVTQGSMEGILLHFRYIYIVVLLLASVYTYRKCRKLSHLGALCGASMLLLYAPFGISALSYNSMGIILSVLATVTYIDASGRGFRQVLSGGFFAGAVLCCPFLACLYIPFTLLSVIPRDNRRQRIRAWLWVTAGVALVATVFIVFVLSRATVAEIRQCLPYMFDDAVHPQRSLLKRLHNYCLFIYTFYDKRQLAALLLLLLTYLVLLFDRKRLRHRALYLAVATPIFLYLMYYCAVTNCYINFTVMPLFYFAPMAYALIERNKAAAKYVMWGIYPFGLLYSLLITFASSTEIYAVSSAMFVASFATALLFGILLEELLSEAVSGRRERVLRRVGVLGACGILLIQLAGLSYTRYVQVFWESTGMAGQTARIESGIERGILVTPEARDYDAARTSVAAQLHAIGGERDDLTLLVAGVEPGLYLSCGQFACGCYNTWPETDEKMQRKLAVYYQLHPEKIPDCVWVGDADEEVVAWLVETYGYRETAVQLGSLLIRESTFPTVP